MDAIAGWLAEHTDKGFYRKFLQELAASAPIITQKLAPQ